MGCICAIQPISDISTWTIIAVSLYNFAIMSITAHSLNRPGALVASHPGQLLRCNVFPIASLPGSFCVEIYTEDEVETRTVLRTTMNTNELAAFRSALIPPEPASSPTPADTQVHYAHKQVLVLRKDLNMRKGKMVAQGAHASQMAVYPRPTEDDVARGWMAVNLNEHSTPWLRDNFKKIAVAVNSEQELRAVHEAALAAGIPCSLVTDSGLTEFGGVPTVTAVAVGPAHEDIVNRITGALPLL